MSAVVSLTIAGRAYEMSCDEGQEQTLIDLSVEIDHRAQQLLKSVGPVSDTRLLVMVALTLVDDLTEARNRLPAPVVDDQATDSKIAAGLDRLAGRIEAIADRLEKA